MSENAKTAPAKAIVSPNIRVRRPETFAVGEGSVVDDFCYFSARVTVGRYCHVASGCSIAGGQDWSFSLGDYSSLSSGVKIWCSSDDFVRDLITLIPAGFPPVKENLIAGDVVCDRLTGVGANSVVMPDNHVPEGCVIGALSFVPARSKLLPWTVYAGTPVRELKPRDRDSVLRQLDRFERELAARKQS